MYQLSPTPFPGTSEDFKKYRHLQAHYSAAQVTADWICGNTPRSIHSFLYEAEVLPDGFAETTEAPRPWETASSCGPNWIAVGTLLHWLKKTNCSRIQSNVTSEGADHARQFQSEGR